MRKFSWIFALLLATLFVVPADAHFFTGRVGFGYNTFAVATPFVSTVAYPTFVAPTYVVPSVVAPAYVAPAVQVAQPTVAYPAVAPAVAADPVVAAPLVTTVPLYASTYVAPSFTFAAVTPFYSSFYGASTFYGNRAVVTVPRVFNTVGRGVNVNVGRFHVGVGRR